MRGSVTFVTSFSSPWIGKSFRNVSKSHACSAYTLTHSRTFMIQRPDRDGPPDLEAFFDRKSKAVGAEGERISLGTGRALLENNENDVVKTSLAALSTARRSLSTEPQLVHCTFSLDVDAHIVSQTLQREVRAPILGRSVNKKGACGTIEILALSSGVEKGISCASATVDARSGRESAAKESAMTAANEALDGLVTRGSCTFMMFCHTPGEDDSVRAGLNETFQGVIAYGGPAVGEETSGDAWSLLGGGSLRTGDTQDSKTVHVAVVPGSLSFLYSAVIKNWAQPAFTEPLPYMTPSYVGDPQIDLLTAIRYNDWEKFFWCMEKEGIDVNTTWKSKQNQSPLLAACARARTDMIKYLLDHGADVGHRNDGGFSASMYTRMLSEYDRQLILDQLKMLEDAGANTLLTEQEREMLLRAASGRIVD